MIIDVIQTKSNFAYEFEVCYDKELTYRTSASAKSLFNLDGNLIYEIKHMSKRDNIGMISFWIFSILVMVICAYISNLPLKILIIICLLIALVLFTVLRKGKSRICEISDGFNDKIVVFSSNVEGFLNGYCSISFNNKELKLYTLSKSDYKYTSIYLDDTQIGQINKHLRMVNNKNNYIIYLLDEHKSLADLLSMFVIYIDRFDTNRDEMISYGVKKSWAWSYSKNNKFYDPTWITTHFTNLDQ